MKLSQFGYVWLLQQPSQVLKRHKNKEKLKK